MISTGVIRRRDHFFGQPVARQRTRISPSPPGCCRPGRTPMRWPPAAWSTSPLRWS